MTPYPNIYSVIPSPATVTVLTGRGTVLENCTHSIPMVNPTEDGAEKGKGLGLRLEALLWSLTLLTLWSDAEEPMWTRWGMGLVCIHGVDREDCLLRINTGSTVPRGISHRGEQAGRHGKNLKPTRGWPWYLRMRVSHSSVWSSESDAGGATHDGAGDESSLSMGHITPVMPT